MRIGVVVSSSKDLFDFFGTDIDLVKHVHAVKAHPDEEVEVHLLSVEVELVNRLIDCVFEAFLEFREKLLSFV